MSYTITLDRIPATDPRLGRHVHHDSRSLAYPVRATGSPQPVRHKRQAPVMDQGQVGACTAFAAVGCLGTDPFFDTLATKPTFDDTTALALYSEETAVDPYPGTYPPDDTGSDGLTAAKVLKSHGWISGYQHALTADAALAELVNRPFIVGVNWYDSMFDPTPSGLVVIGARAKVAGGHEFVVDEYTADGRVGCTNSWGSGFGVGGRFWMTPGTFARLLSEDGDATFFVPLTQPPPPPVTPPATGLAKLAVDIGPWLNGKWACTGAGKAKTAVRSYLDGQGVPWRVS